MEFITSSGHISDCEITPEEVARNEEQYFSCAEPGRLALARYLSTIAELDPKFVADRRLWNWVATYLKERDALMFPVASEPWGNGLQRKRKLRNFD
jgi:hypothetical protein